MLYPTLNLWPRITQVFQRRICQQKFRCYLAGNDLDWGIGVLFFLEGNIGTVGREAEDLDELMNNLHMVPWEKKAKWQ